MELESVYSVFRSFWVVWLMAIFIGIVAWAFWPKRKQQLEAHGRIPLDDDFDDKREDR